LEFNPSVLNRLEQISVNFKQLEIKMADPDITADPDTYMGLAKQYRELEPIMEALGEFQSQVSELEEYETILSAKGEDPDLVEIARDSIGDLKDKVEASYQSLLRLLLPKDPLDGKNAILEIRAGTGGDEAGLFAAEMFRAYARFAETQGWKVNISSYNETDIGGCKEVSCVIEGRDVFSLLKYESGTHRVQRVPQTESQGRVHTSAITVAILPEAEEVDVQIEEKDIRVDTFRSSGAGGQHVNTTDSAVRITHHPSGIVVSCQDERSKIKNKEKAMRILRSHLYDRKLREQQDQIASERRSMVGSGDRSEKIRTYNFPQGRVTDHRIKFSLYSLDEYMQGNMTAMMDACRTEFEAKRIQEQFN